MDDEFARDVGEEYETIDDLRNEIRRQLEEAAERNSREEYLTHIFDALLDGIVTINYPPVMVENEIDNMLEDFERQLRQQGMNLEEYRNLSGQSEEDMRDDFEEEARSQLERALILGELIDEEDLSVTDADIDREIDTVITPYGEQAEAARQLFSSPASRRSMSNRLLAERAIDRLIAIAKGEDPPKGNPPAPEPEEPPADEAVETPEPGEPVASAADDTTTPVDEPAGDEQASAADDQEPQAGPDDDDASPESNEDHIENDEETG